MKNYPFVIVVLLVTGIMFSQSIPCPIDHEDLNAGYFDLQYEFGLPYDPELPTVVIVSDAQQFYVRSGRVNKIQSELFGKKVNVLGVIPRSGNKDLLDKVDLKDNGKTNWRDAYKVFKSKQFIYDLELLINTVLPGRQNIYMYGQSGGAFLITEYLTEFPDSRVKKVFLGASVNPVIEHKLGILHDNFHRDYVSKNEAVKSQLEAILSNGYFDRKLVCSLFQRQNFFVGLAELPKERSKLMDRLYVKDTAYIDTLRKNYQVDAINNLFKSSRGISIRVRLAEFIEPLIGDWEKNKNGFYPDFENSYNIAFPVLDLKNKYPNFQILESFVEEEFRRYKGKIFILSGRYDHVADYRSSIYMSGLSENSFLFIVNDDHTFKSLKTDGVYKKLVQDFFRSSNQKWTEKYNVYRWSEQ